MTNPSSPVRTVGQTENGMPLFLLYRQPDGRGRVVMNGRALHEVGLNADQVFQAFANVQAAHQRLPSGQRFHDHIVPFKENGHSMQFQDFHNIGLAQASGRLWNQHPQGAEVRFASFDKAAAFLTFLENNLARSLTQFPEAWGAVGESLAKAGGPRLGTVEPCPVCAPDRLGERLDARAPTPSVAPTLTGQRPAPTV